MKHYLHKFQDQTAYNTAKAGQDFYKPAVSLIENDMSIVYDPLPPAPTIEMVDLGLTSGTLWAANNIGATPGSTKESYYGDYYAWGEVETKSDYSWSTYTRHTNGIYSSSNKKVFTKYVPTSKESEYWAGSSSADNKLVLDVVDDIVTATYGSSYVMPTIDNIQELIDETDNEWVTDYNGITGLNGCKFMKKFDHSVFIFIPAAGYFYGSSVNDAGNYDDVWSSSLDSGSPNCARYLRFFSYGVDGAGNNYRCGGYSVRPVQHIS